MGKSGSMVLVILALLASIISGLGQTGAIESNEILDYDITVNSNKDGSYNISLRAEKEDYYVYFDDIKTDEILVGTAQITSPPASTAPTADYLIHEAGPEWGSYTVMKLPNMISIYSDDGKIKRSKDLSKYVPEAFNNNYYVNDYIIKSDDGIETGLKIKMQYPNGLMAHEIGLLNISVTTKNQGHNKKPDWQNNILGFCLIKIAGNENLREENEFHGTTKLMLVDPIIIGESEYDLVHNKFIVKGVLIPHNRWVVYDDNLREFVKMNYQGTLSAAQALDANLYKTAIFSIIKAPVELLYEGTEIIFTNFGLDVDSIYSNIEKWQIDYTIGMKPSNCFADENDYDCWTFVYGFNAHENLCTGANGVCLKWPFSFDTEEDHAIKVHVDTMFEGDIPSLGIKGGRIGKEYSLDLSGSKPTIPVMIFPDPNEEDLSQNINLEKFAISINWDIIKGFYADCTVILSNKGNKDGKAIVTIIDECGNEFESFVMEVPKNSTASKKFRTNVHMTTEKLFCDVKPINI